MMKITEVKVETVKIDGQIMPKAFTWKDGTRYEVTKVLFYSRSDDGEYEGIRYTVSFNGAERFLYLINDRWFVQEA